MTLAERFWSKVEKRGPNECWLWTAALNPDGYGLINVGGRSDRAHRVAWKLAHGSIPKGKCVVHKCGNRACVNLRHLALETRTEYMVEALQRRYSDPKNRNKASQHFKRLWRDPGYRRKMKRARTQPMPERFWARVNKNGPTVRQDLGSCWLWTGTFHTHGYGIININGKATRAHRVSWTLVHGPISRGTCILHKCDVRACVNHDHLFSGTHADNNRDAMNKGITRLAGVKRAKLTADDVKTIRAAYETRKFTRAELGKLYGVTWGNIYAIVTKRSWRYV